MNTPENLKEQLFDLIDEYFPKGECKERGQAIALITRAFLAFDKAMDYVIGPDLDEFQDAYNTAKNYQRVRKSKILEEDVV